MEQTNRKENIRSFLTKVALCCAGYGLVSNAVITPIFSIITKEFPTASAALTNFVRTGNFIVSVPFALLSAMLVRYISKKKLLVVALTLFVLGGVGAAFAPSMEFLAVTRAFDAASDGMATSLVVSLIAEIYKDEKTRSQVMGMQNGVACALGIGIGLPAGILGTFGWRYAFLLNSGAVLSLLLVIFFVPDLKPAREMEKQVKEKISVSRRSVWIVVRSLIMFFIIQMIYSQLLYMLGSIVDEQGIGNTVYSGTMVSIINITMVVTYVVFSPCYLKLKQYLPIVGFIATGLSMGVMVFCASKLSFGVMVVIATFAAAVVYPYYPLLIADCLPEGAVPFWMSVYTVVIYTASSFSSYIPGLIGKFVKINTIAGSFIYSGGLLILLAVVMWLIPKWFVPESTGNQEADLNRAEGY